MSRGRSEQVGARRNEAEQRACRHPASSEWAWLGGEPAESQAMPSSEPERGQARGEETQQPDQTILKATKKTVHYTARTVGPDKGLLIDERHGLP